MTNASRSPSPQAREIQRVVSDFESLARRARLLLIAQRAGLVLAAFLAAVLALGLIDFALRLPQGLRILHWLAGLTLIIFVFLKWILPAIRFRPTLTEIALRIERQRPDLASVLASGVEFSRAETEPQRQRAVERYLAEQVVADAANRWRLADHARFLRPAGALRAVGLFVLALAVVSSLFILDDRRAGLGLERTLTPWSSAAWPSRTAIADVTNIDVHPLGAAIPLRAALTRTHRAPDRTDVEARYRLVRDGRPGPVRRALLTWQKRDVSLTEPLDGARDGALFERLVEADADAVEYRFASLDFETPWRRIQLTPPPDVQGAEARIQPPAYAGALAAAEGADAAFTPSSREMGPGRDERAIAPRSLAGSQIALTLRFNKPVEIRPDDPAWLAGALGPDLAAATVDIEAGESRERMIIRWTLEESARIPISLVDDYGIMSVEESVFRFEAVQDRPPSVTVTDPDADISVLPTAVVPVEGEARDDVGLSELWIERRIARPAAAPGREPSGPGGAIEPEDQPTEITRAGVAGRLVASVDHELDLSVLGLRPGDQIWLTAAATDILAAEAMEREAERSPVRKLFIISEADFIEEVRDELARVRQQAIRLDETQAELRRRLRRGVMSEELRRGQAQVTERVARQNENVDNLRQRLRRNGLTDERLDGLLSDADAMLEQAGEASRDASERLDEAARRQREGDAPQADQAEAQDQQGAQGEQGRSGQEGQQAQQGDQSQRGEQGGQQAQQGDQARPGEQGQEGDQAQRGEQGQQGQQGQQGEQSDARGQQGQQGQQRQGGQQRQPEEDDGAEEPRPEQDPQPEPPPEEDLEPEQEQIDRAQERVQDALEGLIEMLDQGEDAWVMRRSLENIIEEQDELRERTAEAASRTAGRSLEELSEQERTELDEIVQRQQDLAERTDELAEDLEQRAEQMRESDPAAAAGMQEAARRAQQSRTSETQQQAAQQAEQNQLSRAGQSQEQALEDLEEMMQDLDEAERVREETLRRVLASVLESLEALIRRQEIELAALDQAEQRGDLTELDRGMIQLNQNTLGALDQVKAADRTLAPVANIIGQAADAQTRAIMALREAPPAAQRARTAEEESLELLIEARDTAEEIQQQLQQEAQDRRRRELRQAYRELLERQVAVRAETDPYAQQDELSRRDRASLRGLSEQQSSIREDLEALLEQTQELMDAAVFEFAHRRLDFVTDEAAERLRRAEPRPALPREDQAVALLQGVVEALRELTPDQDEFSQGDQQGGGGSGEQQQGQQPLIPPIAELKLLRQIQAGIAQRTRAVAEGDEPREPADIEDLGAQQRELGRIGAELINRMRQQGQGGPPTPTREGEPQ